MAVFDDFEQVASALVVQGREREVGVMPTSENDGLIRYHVTA